MGGYPDRSSAAVAAAQALIPKRMKNEVSWVSAGTLFTMPADTTANLIAALKSITPTSGSLTSAPPGRADWARFFNTTSNKLNVFNEGESLYFKISLVGTWAGGLSARSMQISFAGTNGNNLVANRNSAVTGSDTITLDVSLSIDKNGNIATNGTAISYRANGGSFAVQSVFLIAEQKTTLPAIVPV